MSTTPKKQGASEQTYLAHKYQIKSDIQHVLDNPDTYTGAMEMTDYDTFVFGPDARIISQQVRIIPGLYKLFDEGAVNCRDHVVRMKQQADSIPVTEIDIDIAADGVVTMYNNGNGIDVAKHPEEDLWIPEMIFGHLRTSTNYDKSEKKIVGGKNGFGFKLVLIWSKWGEIETIDHVRGLKYTQRFENNLSVIHPPKITKCTSKKPYTKVTFMPDFARLGLTGWGEDMLQLLKRRVYDLAAVTDKSVKVKFNHELIPVKDFASYVDMYIGDKAQTPRVCEQANDRWEFVACLAPKQEFTQVSFVNGIFTAKGGKHVDYILNQIVRKMSAFIKAKKKIDVKPATIKEQIMLFLRCDVDNPSFDSQTKDYLSTPPANFGSACEVSDKFIEKLAKLGIMDTACALTEVKDTQAAKRNDGTKSRSVRGIPKLSDANYAGTANSHLCTLILCEGDSAKGGIMGGLTMEDRNVFGIYPLRGKLFNVRGETAKRISEVKEIAEIKQIMGLQQGRKYTEEEARKSLRYGRVIFMTDQDLDGSHIKGLCINLFDCEWQSLLAIPGFFGFMNTPIIKAHKGKQEVVFYNDGQYEAWKQQVGGDRDSWKIKYYKGLGTSQPKEWKEYFATKKIVTFTSTGDVSHNAIDMAFNKKRVKDRKEWLTTYNRHVYLDTNQPTVPYEKFIQEELVHFSQKDCERSIPNLVDGLKTSHRKILFACLKRDLSKDEVKVAMLAGSVAELSHYHHGEKSLYDAIIGMAQTFVGSNNVNLLLPQGTFGTRLQGGDDAASPRYIDTLLNPLTRLIFPKDDDAVLTYLEDDGVPVEPMYYAPILPMLLVNGSHGIGTGFSTDIESYNPLDLLAYVKAFLHGDEAAKAAVTLVPYYEGFNGTVTPIEGETAKFLIKGTYRVVNDKQVQITELPIGLWTDDYKAYLEDLIQGPSIDAKKSKTANGDAASVGEEKKKLVKDYVDMSTDTTVNITITFANNTVIQELQAETVDHGCNALEKLLKLYTTRSTTNMHAFDHEERLVKFGTVKELIDAYIPIRLQTYEQRKRHLVQALEAEAQRLTNKARFIMEILQNEIDLRRQKRQVILDLLRHRGYTEDRGDFEYLLRMPMQSLTEEHVTSLEAEKDKTLARLATLRQTSERHMWLEELQTFETAYLASKQKHQQEMTSVCSVNKKRKAVSKA